MLELKKGVEILAKVGGVETLAEAKEIFAQKLDAENLAKLEKIQTEEALLKIANAIAHCKHDRASAAIFLQSYGNVVQIRPDRDPLAGSVRHERQAMGLADEQLRLIDQASSRVRHAVQTVLADADNVDLRFSSQCHILPKVLDSRIASLPMPSP